MCYVDDKEMEVGSQAGTGSSGCDCALTHHNV